MTKSDQIKIHNNKTRANNAQYNLDRENAEISAYSNGDLNKYEYLTNQDLRYKPDALQQARLEYSPLGNVLFGKLDKRENKVDERNESKKVGILKRLKNIEDNIKQRDENQNVEDKDEGAEGKEVIDILEKYANKRLISRYKNANRDLPPIDGRPVSEALNALARNEITQDEFYEIYNPFNTQFAELNRIKRRGGLGDKQKLLVDLNNDVKDVIESSQNGNIPPLEGRGLYYKKQTKNKGFGSSAKHVKILTPNQMLARLPILLAQIEAGNNSQQLKYEIRQLLYSLYR